MMAIWIACQFAIAPIDFLFDRFCVSFIRCSQEESDDISFFEVDSRVATELVVLEAALFDFEPGSDSGFLNVFDDGSFWFGG